MAEEVAIWAALAMSAWATYQSARWRRGQKPQQLPYGGIALLMWEMAGSKLSVAL